jgi:hypothetical protein
MNKTIKLVLVYTLLAGLLFAGAQIYQVYASKVQADQLQQHEKTLRQVKDLAQHGKLINSGAFGLNSNKNDIIKKWGKPEMEDKWLLSYKKPSVEFQLEGTKVVALQTADESLTSIAYTEVQKVLGKGVPIENMGDLFEVHYSIGKNNLVFTFPVKTKQNNFNPKVFGVRVKS